jgi:hypothetical protein
LKLHHSFVNKLY